MNDAAFSHQEQAHLIIYNRWVMLGGHAAFVVVVALLYLFYRAVVPDAQMTAWLILASVILIYIAVFDVALFVRNPSPAELLKFWRALDKKHTMLFDAIAVGVIILLLPFGGEGHRLITVSFCVGYVPLQMISDPENVFGNRFSIVSVLGAFIGFLLVTGSAYEYVLAGFMLVYGLTLYFASGAFRNVVVDALRDREASEAANAQLERAVADVSAERDAKTRFIAMASHDLGQPIQAARLFSEQLANAANDCVRTRMHNSLDRAIISAQHMLSHMLSHLRLEADAVTPYPKPVDIKELLHRMAAQFGIQAAQNAMDLRIVGAGGMVTTDPVLIERAVGNLIQNAIIHSDAKRIVIGSRRCSGELHLWVIDDGVGIKAGDTVRIFDDYGQGSNSQSPINGGFGLGLSSVLRLAQLLGGKAFLDTRWTNGAAFCIVLPIGGNADA